MHLRLVPAICLTLIFAPFGHADAACDPAVRLIGAPELRAALLLDLQGRGIPAAVPSCPALPVELSQTPSGIRLRRLTDGVSMEVGEVRTAANLIESWLRADISAPLLDRRTLIVRHDSLITQGAPAPGGPRPERLQLGASVETTLTTDASPWLGASLSGCGRVRRACLGLRLRVASDLRPPVISDYAVRRLDAAALLTAALRFPLGRISLQPGIALGAGLGWTQLSGAILGGSATAGGLRAEIGLDAQVQLGAGFAAGFDLGLGAAYPSQPSTVRTFAMVDVHQGRGQDDPQDVVMPEGPFGQLRLGVGLRWSGR